MELQQDIAQAKAQAIEALEASMRASKRLIEMELQAGLMTETLYKHYTDSYHKRRIELLVLRGEIPDSREKKKSRSMNAQWTAAVSNAL